jgi:subtilase family serine protease
MAAGQSVAIVDAYRDPDITSDVNTFSKQYGLPPVCGTAGAGSDCFSFRASAPRGTPVNSSWSLETSLDVEWIHAVAPKAAIRLLEAHDPGFGSMFAAVTAAAALDPDTISMSWGDPLGEFSGESYYNARCQLAESVCVAATGDEGHPGQYPAYNPSVLAIGGTTLNLSHNGTVASETSWNGSGGGLSYFQAKPPAQHGVTPGATRGIPDVSFDADPSTGVAVYDSDSYDGQAGWFEVGGTSVGAPVWSAILADADQLRAAAGKSRLTSADDEARQAVYGATSALAAITSGERNGPCPAECVPGPGYDFITGLGSPRTGVDAAIAAAP